MPIYEEECRRCGFINERFDPLPNENTRRCVKCEGQTDRIYSLSVPKIFESFTTRNIISDGTPVTVRGPGQLRQLEAEHGVKMVDGGPPPQTQFPQPS